ncbi:sulfate transporter CysZ [Escherichia coli]|uniref:sulfate transporter CysZ n=1 Tax=Escherichia coli TaxID=562 RepID=UPI003976EC87
MALYATRCLDPDSHELCSDWLQWLSYLLWPLAVISVLLVFGYFFSTIANWIAAPFNGLLAEQLEARLTGATPPDTGIFGIMKDAANHETRMAKICLVSATRNCINSSSIPGIGQTVAPVLWFLFSAWMLAIHIAITPSINKVPFKEMRTALRTRKITNMQFGALTSLFTMIPLLICSSCPLPFVARRRVVDCYRDKHAMWR